MANVWAARARHFREMAEGLGNSFSAGERVSGGPARNLMEDYSIAAADAQRNADENASRHLELVHQADELIATMESEDLRNVLTMRYISGKNADQIADALYISKRTYYRRHDRALKELERQE